MSFLFFLSILFGSSEGWLCVQPPVSCFGRKERVVLRFPGCSVDCNGNYSIHANILPYTFPALNAKKNQGAVNVSCRNDLVL